MADENAQLVALMGRCHRFEAKSIQFFDAFDSLIVCSHAYISRSGDFRADNDNDNDNDDRQTNQPLAYACGLKM